MMSRGDNRKKIMPFLFVIILMVCLFYLFIISAKKTPLLGREILDAQAVDRCYEISYHQAKDIIKGLDSTFIALEICNNPFIQIIFFIKYFSQFTTNANGYLSINEILSEKKSNVPSNAIAIVSLMHQMGWDIQLFYNEKECYLGINFSPQWMMRKGNWIEIGGRRYYLKELDTPTPVGELRFDYPDSKYCSLKPKRISLKPIPIMRELPGFAGGSIKKSLVWRFHKREYHLDIEILKEQLDYTKNLPISLYGTVYSGAMEIQKIGLADELKLLTCEFDEFDRVNFLLKFCQSENIFTYDSSQQIKSVTCQLIEGTNDCDGRSVFLYSLLVAVLDYSYSDIVFLSWPNHLALGLRPRTEEAKMILQMDGVCIGEYYILDPAFAGKTHWGSKMRRLPNRCTIISLPE